MRLLKLLLVIFVCAAGPAVAGPLEDADAAYTKGAYATAIRLFRPLAEQGDAMAQNNLGVMYFNGKGVTQDYQQAVFWYRKAAEQGDGIAQNNLGAMYANGRGVTQDYVQAVFWFRKGADQGEASAQSSLGAMYGNGWGVTQDYILAHMWWNLAAAKGEATAVKNRDSVAAKMTPAQIAEAQKLAREWKPKQ